MFTVTVLNVLGVNMKALLLILLLTSCGHVEFIEGTATEKFKVNILMLDNCKIRLKFSKQGCQCKWKTDLLGG